MKPLLRICLICFLLMIHSGNVDGQINDICAEAGITPSFDSPFAHVPYVYGRIILKGFENSRKLPNVIVVLSEPHQNPSRYRVNKTGNYCFRIRNSGGTLTVELDGIETARKTLPSIAPVQQQEDFEISPAGKQNPAPPGVVSAKFYYTPNPKTIEFYNRVREAEAKNHPKKAIEILKTIVTTDSADFIAWAKLGELYFGQELFAEANASFKKCLELQIEYTPVWINLGKMRVAQKQFEAAIEIFKHTLTLEPKSAKIHRLLGEAYLQAKQGTLGAESLNKAIEIDPIGMAECHLELAHLYQLAKLNQMATKEYKMFLSKVPDYKDKKKLEEFIKRNPEY